MNMFALRRNRKGSLVSWLLLIAIFMFMFIIGIIAVEFLIRFVTMSRLQNAAQNSALSFARDMVRYRDNQLSIKNSNNLDFNSATMFSCATGCTRLIGAKASIPGANNNLEYLNASQVLLANIWSQRLEDPSEVDDVNQNQCYTSFDNSRFAKNPSSPEATCRTIGKVTAPLMDLTWEFRAAKYGASFCCQVGDMSNKDFCVNTKIRGRLDPIMAGGLAFLWQLSYIREGRFELNARAVVERMDSQQNTADNGGIANNLSGETIALEQIPRGGCP